jgi:ATP-dependent DNA ligase
LKNTIADNKRFTKPPIAKLPNWRYFFEILAKLGLEIATLTDDFLSTALSQTGNRIEVEPLVVLEIAFDSIRESPRHPSGLALRFPRITRIRRDKSPADIDTLSTARRLLVT